VRHRTSIIDQTTTDEASAVSDAARYAGPHLPAWRLTTWLLIGWCAVLSAWLVAASARQATCPHGQSCEPHRLFGGPGVLFRWAVFALAGALALAALRWWDGRRMRTMPGRPRQRMPVAMCALISVGAAVAGTQLLLYAPKMSKQIYCVTPVRLPGVRFYPLNCDSAAFMALAHHPGEILQPREPRQSRPGYVALAALSTHILGPTANRLGWDRAFREKDSAYIPLILINLILLVASAFLLTLLLRRLGAPPVLVVPALCLLLVANDVTKAFFWTPHQQMFELLVPVATITIACWVMRTRPGWRGIAATAVALGLASLVYASVLITVAVLVLILLTRGWAGLRLAGLLCAAFALPQLAWIGVCEVVVGSYYNYEMKRYHEFTWLPEAAMHGPHSLYVWVQANWVVTVREFVWTAGLPLLFLLGLVVAAVLAGIRLAPASEDERRILTATGLTICCSVLFTFGIGIFATRIMYHVFPAVLVLAGWITAKLIASPRVAWRFAILTVPVATVGYVVHELTSHGPYS